MSIHEVRDGMRAWAGVVGGRGVRDGLCCALVMSARAAGTAAGKKATDDRDEDADAWAGPTGRGMPGQPRWNPTNLVGTQRDS